VAQDGWPALFASAFNQSRNAMLLVDEQRRIVDANPATARLLGRALPALRERRVWELVAGGPLATPHQWHEALAQRRFTGETALLHADGSEVPVQWGATTEGASGHRRVLFVVLGTSRWGSHFRRAEDGSSAGAPLSAREAEIVRRVAMGETSPEIAGELGISPDTVRTHVRNAMAKVGARSRAHLVAKALGEALV
jgi:PAS domain S-box-containing protein